MVEFPKIPTRIIPSGDKKAAMKLAGLGKKRYADLVTSLGFQGLEYGFNTLNFHNGTTIKTSQSFGVSKIEIYVPHIEIEEEVIKLPSFIDLRFFVRVGSDEDVVIDELTGETLEDYTKYYWIDFYDDDGIKFYRQGEELEKEQTTAPAVNRNTLLEVADPPPYMEDLSVKAFDLPYTSTERIDKVQRFVMGYHYLSKNHNIIYTVEQHLLPMPDACVYDFDIGATKCPVNRIFYDIDSQTLAWYHVAQEWMDLAVGFPNEYTESTGSIGALIGQLEYELEDGATEPSWVFKRNKSFKLSGAKAKLEYGFSDGPWGDIVREPVCITADILSLDREEAVIHCPYQHQLFEFIYSFEETDYTSCEEIEESQTALIGQDDFIFKNTATWTSEEALASSDLNTIDSGWDYIVCNYANWQDCTDSSNIKYERAYTTDNKITRDRDISHTGLNLPHGEEGAGGIFLYQFAKATNGMNAGDELEDVEDFGAFCRWTSSCGRANYVQRNSKEITGFLTGSYGTQIFSTVPAQNITRTETLSKIVYDIDTSRALHWDPGSCPNYIANGSVIGNSVEEFCEVANFDPPNYGEGYTLHQLYTTSWPVGYQFRDPIDLCDEFGAYPFAFPALTYSATSITKSWTNTTVGYSHTENETLNTVTVYGIDEEFDRNSITNVSYLDDRGTVDSHGVVVFLKDSDVDSSRVFHGDTTFTDKTTAFMTALEDQGLIEEDEYVYTIGLL